MGVVIKEALANGRLTARNEDPAFALRRSVPEAEAGRLGTTIEALALAVALAQPWADVVLSGAVTVETLRSNLSALEVDWDDDLEGELSGLAATRIGAGEWPWSFFCFLEGRPQPITPSALAVIAPGDRLLGVAARCPCCAATSVNLVTREHLDIPFWNDRSVGVVDHVFAEDALRTVAEFRSLLDSARFDERRLELEW